MESSEIHYLTFDPEQIYREMQGAYMENGGSVLYPGDEKEMLLRSMQSVIVQAFAGVDHALRMATLRYAVGDYLDLYGEKRGCSRMEAKNAQASVDIQFLASGTTGTIEAGTLVTGDGEHLYALDEDVVHTGFAQTVRTTVTAQNSGSAGNGLLAGTQMQFLVPQRNVEKVTCVEDASGGQEREEDEAYRERIRTFGLTNITTGPKAQYEAAAKSVSSEIIDVNPVNQGAGNVGIVLLLASDSGSEAIINNVKQALNDMDARPLTDNVSVFLATEIPYTLNVQYQAESGSETAIAIANAVEAYQKWQDEKIGRAFNPDRLLAMIYQAGATRVLWGDGSVFDGGEVKYTEIDETSICKGVISLGVIA